MKQKIKDLWLRVKIKSKQINWKKLLFGLFVMVIIGVVVGTIGMATLFVYYSKDLPSPTRVIRREGYATRIYDRNGKLLYDLYKDAKRTPIVWEDVPQHLWQATVAIEDKDFYKHQGFDPLTPLRIIKNLIVERRLVGGSTLTQQLVKNVLLTSERSVQRKIKEFILAVQIDARYKKDEVLLMYLNEAPYGGAAWGVGSASEQYFNKQVKDLDLAESAILAALPQRPNVFSPFSKTPKAYLSRTKIVLEKMAEDGYITKQEADSAYSEAENYQFYENKTTIAAPHFVFWLRDELTERFGENALDSGLKVTSSLDLDLQNSMQTMVGEEIDKAEVLGISNGALMIMDPRDGQVLTMIGSRGYFSDKTDGKFNVVTQGLRQPGSSIKPVTYLMALRKGLTPATMIMDTPVTFPSQGSKDYTPQNYNGKFNGPLPLRYALGNSINTTAVKMLATVGVDNMLRQAFDMGITTLEPTKENMSRFGLAVTLGGAEVKMIELSSAYSAFANGGKKVEATGLLKVEDRNQRVLYEYKPVLNKQVVTPQEAFLINNILSDNTSRQLTFGVNNGLVIPNYQVAVKTGTTNDKRDNWAIGWTPNILVSAWVGNNDNSPMLKVASGVSGATPIWRKAMLAVLSKREKQDFPIPEGIVQLEVDAVSGYMSHDGFPTRKDYFLDGTQPHTDDPIHLKLKICKDKPGLAPPADVATNNYNEKEYFKFVESDPVSKDGKNRWQEGIDAWIAKLSADQQDKYKPPSDYCRQDGMIDVAIDSPAHQSTVGNSFKIVINPKAAKKIVEVKLWINGTEKQTWSEKPYEYQADLPDGIYNIKVKATDKDGNSAERSADIGVNKPWDWKAASPTPTSPPATNTPTVIVLPTVAPSPTGVTPTVSVTLSPVPSL